MRVYPLLESTTRPKTVPDTTKRFVVGSHEMIRCTVDCSMTEGGDVDLCGFNDIS